MCGQETPQTSSRMSSNLEPWIFGTSGKDNNDLLQQFPNLFQGLSKSEGDYTIQLKEGAEPYVLSTPCRV